ncbi:MAG: signal peptide peptidase SppA [Candidatus Aminicenantes bacterium]|nr:signal peptide peptidase SppA [Candidatus Aminicenantes bacterium]
MKKFIGLILILALLSGCSPHIHIDFLGKERIEEVELVKSKAKEKILLVDIEGIISSMVSPGFFAREGDLLSQVYYRLEKASKDETVKGVILRLDTPGGEVTASDILYNEILKFKEKTGLPVVGLMMGVAASGGYYVASACDFIIAHPSTLTGSIGVISVFPSLQELLSKVGIKVNVIKSGQMKDSGGFWRDVTEEEKKVFQTIIDDYFQKFVEVVYQNRKESLTREELARIADGRVYTGTQALELKLIDELGYFDQALKKTLSLAALREAKVIAYTYYPQLKTNIYAQGLKEPSLSKNTSIDYENLLQVLKSGFYYLWLPQLAPTP